MKINLENIHLREIGDGLDYRPRRRKRKKPGPIKFLVYLIISLTVVLVIGYFTLKFFVGPIVKTVSALPDNFPQELAIYRADRAKINLQNPASRAKIIGGLKSMPDWLLNIFLGSLSDNLKSQLANNFGDDINIPRNLSVDDLKRALKAADLGNADTVNLSWGGLAETKEQLAAYYKKKLAESDFQFKENLEDYKINLGFWKEGIFGTMSFGDSDTKAKNSGYNSTANITVNYLNERK